MTRALVTGGAGFIGSHLCDRLLAEGDDVLCVDNLLTGTKGNLSHLRKNRHFRFVRHDVTEDLHVAGKLDYVLHFASAASPVDYGKHPIRTLKANALGTHKTLGIAKSKKARFLLASTSEVYGDPEVNPQPETYWGHVDPIGPRSMYDEGKRFAEALAMAYQQQHHMSVRIARIFNSVAGSEPIWLLNDERLHLEPIERYFNQRRPGASVVVPCFDPSDGEVKNFWASAVLQIPFKGTMFTVTTTYGRTVTVTGDHSLFTHDDEMRPVPVPVRQLKRGMRIAVPARLAVPTVDVAQVDVARFLLDNASPEDLWEFSLWDPSFKRQVIQKRIGIFHFLQKRSRSRTPKTAYPLVTHWKRSGWVPLAIVKIFGLKWSDRARINSYRGRHVTSMRNRVRVTKDVLWLLGLFLAEGCHVASRKGYGAVFSSDTPFVQRARRIVQREFGLHVGVVPYTPGRAPSARVNSKPFVEMLTRIFGFGPKRIPSWVLQLPLRRVKHFLAGYNDGDGTHSGSSVGKLIDFNTTSPELAQDLSLLLLRFGIVAPVARYRTTFKQKYGERKFPFFRISIRGLSTYDILRWDKGVTQNLMRKRTGDILWVHVKHITRKQYKGFVYDLCVPGAENFVAGEGVFCHNTYGPRMRLDDGRVVPNFMGQALRGEPLTIYGNGSQTRSFCYVDDLVEGMWRLLNSDVTGPVNLGNPDERMIKDLAELVQKVMSRRVGVVYKPLPPEDPKLRCPDITRARTLLKWEPKVPIEEGLRRTAAYFQEQLASSPKGKP